MTRAHPPPSQLARGPRRGFALIEALVVTVVSLVVLALLLAAGSDARRQGRLGDDIAMLRQFGMWTGSYAADNQDLFWSFSWKKGYSKSQWPDLNAQAQQSELGAVSAQGVDLLRRLAGREDILPISGWYPLQSYAHWVLAEYLRTPIPLLNAVSSADTRLLSWARDPHGFDAGVYQPAPTGGSGAGTNHGKRWPYRSTFMMPAALAEGSRVGQRVSQASSHSQYSVPPLSQFGGRPLSEVAFPTHKVVMHDGHARHFGPLQPYCTHDQARLPLLFADGSVSTRLGAESNPGWHPNSPTNSSLTTFQYSPDVWEPPTMSGAAADSVTGRFRWTRGCPDSMLAGRDFNGPQVCAPLP